jgi:hypothetical protein
MAAMAAEKAGGGGRQGGKQRQVSAHKLWQGKQRQLYSCGSGGGDGNRHRGALQV